MRIGRYLYLTRQIRESLRPHTWFYLLWSDFQLMIRRMNFEIKKIAQTSHSYLQDFEADFEQSWLERHGAPKKKRE